MTQYYENFAGKTLNTTPPEFQIPWGGGVMEIKAGNPLPGSDRHLEIVPDSPNYAREVIKWAVGTTSGVTTVRFRCSVELSGDDGAGGTASRWIIGALVSGSGASTGERTGYTSWVGFDKTRLIKYDGLGSDIDMASAFFSYEYGKYRYDLIIELTRSGDTIESRTWNVGDSRPSVADVSHTDTSSPLPVDGFFGVSILSRDLTPVMRLYEIAVGTDDDEATLEVSPSPIDLTANDITDTSATLNWEWL